MKFSTQKKVNTAIVLMTGVIFVLFICLRILFPDFNYNSNEADLHGISIQKEQLGGKNILHVAPLFDYDYSSVKLKLKAQNKFSDAPEAVDVFRGHLVFAYEQNQHVVTSEELRSILGGTDGKPLSNGQLVSYNDAVHALSDEKMRTFLSPEIFERLGFDWDAVKKVDGDIFGEYEKGEEINFSNSHPSGTVLSVDGNLQIVLDEQRHAISDEIDVEALGDVKPVLISSGELRKVGECVFSGSRKNKMSCDFTPDASSGVEGNEYMFVFSAEVLQEIDTAEVSFNTLGGLDKNVARKTLSRMKTTLGGRYFPEIIK